MSGGRKRRLRPDEAGYEPEARDGRVIELEPFDIVGDPNAPEVPLADVPLEEPADDGRGGRVVHELAPIEIQGRRSAWDSNVPDWVTDIVGRPTTEQGTDFAGWEFPNWIASRVADENGEMPDGLLELGYNAIARNSNPASYGAADAIRALATGEEGVAPEERSMYAVPAIAGAADALSFGFADDAGDAVYGGESGNAIDWAEDQYPGSFNAGADVAIAGQMALPGATMRNAPTFARATGTALEAGLQGALGGYGHSDAETIGGRLDDAATGALTAGALGGGLGYAAGRFGDEAARPVDEDEIARLMRDANLERVSQAGGSQSLSSKRMRTLLPGTSSEDRIEAAARLTNRLREEGVFDPRRVGPIQLPPNSDMIAQRVDDLMEGASDGIGNVHRRMEGQAVDPTTLIGHAWQRLDELEAIPGAEAQAAAMRRHLTEFSNRAESGNLTFDDLQRWKTFWRQNTNFDAPLQADRQGIYRAISNTMQEGVNDVDPALGSQYQRDREMYSIGRRFAEVNADEAMQRARNRTFSLTDYLTGLEGFREGVVPGIGAVLMNRGLRRNEHGMRAMSLERAAEALRTRPERFGRWAPRLEAARQKGSRFFNAALYAAMQDDPQVRQAVMSGDEQEQQAPMEQQSAPVIPEDAPIEMFLEDDTEELIPEDAPITDFL